jgi:hypothetical protein
VVFVNVGAGGNTWMRCQTFAVTRSAAEARNPVGNVEVISAEGRVVRVSGWAMDPDTPTASLEIHVYMNDGLAGVLTADGRRDDVGVAFPGAGSAHGFSWESTADAPGNHRMCVFAINRDAGTRNPLLGCGVAPVSASLFMPFGTLDESIVDGRTVTMRGWSVDADSMAVPLEMHLYADGVYRRAVTAGGARPDVAAVFPGAGPNHGYAGSFPLGPGAHTVCAYALNAGAGTIHPLLGCRAVTVTERAWEPIGNLETARSVGGGRIEASGWVWDPDAGTSSSPVHVYVDGQYRGQWDAAGSRPDVAGVFPEAGAGHGFVASIAVGPGPHTVCAFGINVGLGRMHPLLACQAVTG